MIDKIYVGILVDRARRVAGGLIDDERGGFRAGWSCTSDLYTKVDR